MKIYIKIPKSKFKTIKGLLRLMLDKEIQYGSGRLPTYYDKECTSLQCALGKNRSFRDLYCLCKTYFPNVTKKRVLMELCCLYLPEFKVIIKTCNTLKNCRFGYEKNDNEIFFDTFWSLKYQRSLIEECFNIDTSNMTIKQLDDVLKLELNKFKKQQNYV